MGSPWDAIKKISKGFVLVAVVAFLCLVITLFILSLWDETIGDLIKGTADFWIIGLIFFSIYLLRTRKFQNLFSEIYFFKGKILRLFGFGSRMLWAESSTKGDFYHFFDCPEHLSEIGSSSSLIDSPEKAQSLGFSPCPKCRPPIKSK